MKVNFFWYGNNFTEWESLCFRSHIKVDHEVIIWLADKEPYKNILWEKIKKSSSVIIKNVKDMIDIQNHIDNGGNPQTLSAYWRFKLLYSMGGWYADTDAYAIKHWSEINEWIVASAEEDRLTLSIGIIKAPAHNYIFLECLKNIKYKWGNIKVFDKAFKNYYNSWKPNIKDNEYYPWTWKNWNNLYSKDITIDSLISENVKSIHLYTTMLKRNNAQYNVKGKCLLNEMIDYVR